MTLKNRLLDSFPTLFGLGGFLLIISASAAVGYAKGAEAARDETRIAVFEQTLDSIVQVDAERCPAAINRENQQFCDGVFASYMAVRAKYWEIPAYELP